MNDKKIIKRHSQLYEMLQVCENIEEYEKMWREYAELDVKVARIVNNDIAQRKRNEYESQFNIIR